MRFWIDIEASDGTKYGSGPITSATGWQSNPVLSRPGTFSFSMPAADPKAALVQKLRVARCWAYENGEVVEKGAGIINQVVFSGGSPAMLEISGDGLGRELTYRLAQNLSQVEESELVGSVYGVKFYNGSTTSDMPNSYDGDDGTYSEFSLTYGPGTGGADYLYVLLEDQYDAIYLNISQGNANDVVLSGAQYYTLSGGWSDLTNVQDSTGVFATSGTIRWAVPPDWGVGGTAGGSTKYHVRFRTSWSTTTVRLNEVYAVEQTTVSTDIESIMDEAPAGWSLDTSNWHGSTANGSYLQFTEETVLAALIKTADMSGEHFRIVGREVEWMRTDTPSSGIRCVGPGFDAAAVAGNELVALIVPGSFREVEDAYDIASRIYPFGSGNGGARLTLHDCSITPPAGYTLNTTENYLEKDSVTPEIHRVATFTNIQSIGYSADARESGSNQLYYAAKALLDSLTEAPKFYEFELQNLHEEVLPGETVQVVYRDVVDGYVMIDVDEELVVLGSAVRIDANGLSTVALSVATVTRQPATDEDLMAQQIGELQDAQAYPQPIGESQVISGV